MIPTTLCVDRQPIPRQIELLDNFDGDRTKLMTLENEWIWRERLCSKHQSPTGNSHVTGSRFREDEVLRRRACSTEVPTNLIRDFASLSHRYCKPIPKLAQGRVSSGVSNGKLIESIGCFLKVYRSVFGVD